MASRITNVRVAQPGTHEQHITDFKMDTGTAFTKSQMVAYVSMSPGSYYTSADGKRAEVIVAQSENNVPYVKTKPDSTTKNNLLSLPRF